MLISQNRIWYWGSDIFESERILILLTPDIYKSKHNLHTKIHEPDIIQIYSYIYQLRVGYTYTCECRRSKKIEDELFICKHILFVHKYILFKILFLNIYCFLTFFVQKYRWTRSLENIPENSQFKIIGNSRTPDPTNILKIPRYKLLSNLSIGALSKSLNQTKNLGKVSSKTYTKSLYPVLQWRWGVKTLETAYGTIQY